MNLLAASLRWMLCAALALPITAAMAAGLDPDMRAALRQLVDAQQLDRTMPALLDSARLRGIEQVRQEAGQSIADNRQLSEADRARARKIMEEMAPQLVAGVDADMRKLDLQALALEMVEAVYPKYYSLEEVRQLAAYHASPGYRKMLEAMRKVEQEHARTGANKEQLWRLYTNGVSAQEQREVGAFLASPLAKKGKQIGEQVQEEGSAYVRRKIAPAFTGAAAAHRKLFLGKLAQAQAR